jgi:hypothetical protein
MVSLNSECDLDGGGAELGGVAAHRQLSSHIRRGLRRPAYQGHRLLGVLAQSTWTSRYSSAPSVQAAAVSIRRSQTVLVAVYRVRTTVALTLDANPQRSAALHDAAERRRTPMAMMVRGSRGGMLVHSGKAHSVAGNGLFPATSPLGRRRGRRVAGGVPGAARGGAAVGGRGERGAAPARHRHRGRMAGAAAARGHGGRAQPRQGCRRLGPFMPRTLQALVDGHRAATGSRRRGRHASTTGAA